MAACKTYSVCPASESLENNPNVWQTRPAKTRLGKAADPRVGELYRNEELARAHIKLSLS